MINDAAHMLFLMAAAHALADFGLQTPHHSAAKRPGNTTGIPWQVGLGMHSLIHGGFVAMITGLWWLGAAETVMHAAIDHAKGQRWFGAKTDQTLHALCKIAWVIIAINA